MKVLHLNTYQVGGAALCAKRIDKALKQQGIDSKMLFGYGSTMPKGVEGSIAIRDRNWFYSNVLIRKAYNFYLRHLTREMNAVKMQNILDKANSNHLYLHHPLSNYNNLSDHPLIEWADIIHLHWVADFVDYPTFFKDVRKPIVWTLHDVFPAYGTFHFFATKTSMNDKLKEVEFMCKKMKRDAIEGSNIYLVAISEKMREVCKTSYVLEGFPVTLIHNGVETESFIQEEKMREPYTFLFSAYDIWDERKGLKKIISALEKIELKGKRLIIIGNNETGKPVEATFAIEERGFINDNQTMSKIYSKAGFFINASSEEGFAQAPLEAMACGTPVISTPVSGASDLIRPFNGVICDGFEVDAIVAGIRTAIATEYDSKAIRQHILDHYRYDIIARQYINLYNDILKRQNFLNRTTNASPSHI